MWVDISIGTIFDPVHPNLQTGVEFDTEILENGGRYSKILYWKVRKLWVGFDCYKS